jgi:hypothetical protein
MNIDFHSYNHTEVLRLSKDGIWANPDIPVDEAAKLVLAAMEWNIKVLVDKAVADEREQGQKWFDAVTAQHKQAILAEREACAHLAQKTVCDVHIPTGTKIYGTAVAKAIRARSNT